MFRWSDMLVCISLVFEVELYICNHFCSEAFWLKFHLTGSKVTWLTHLVSSDCNRVLCVCVRLFLQAVGGYRRWAQWHPVRLCSLRSARLAGVNFHTSDGADVETVGGKATISQHCARGASRDICGKVCERFSKANGIK